ncbi:MAG: response regulator [Acidobacteriota bacterium]|nr:response regulator [Acidobacteriota bacterium]
MSFNILVVDDSAVMRAMIIRVLRLTGLSLGEIYEAPNGREGLRILDEKWVDLALVDINMPVMNGEEMIDNVRSNQTLADLPIVVISTESNMERVESIRKKRVEFVHKPFTPEVLRKTVMQLTGVSNEQLISENSLSEGGPDF